MKTTEKQLQLFLSACRNDECTIEMLKGILTRMMDKMNDPRANVIKDSRLLKKLKSQLVLWEAGAAMSSHQLLMDGQARSMLEEFLLSLVMQENVEVVWRKNDLVYLLVWAVEKEMQELAEQLILTESVSCMQEVRYRERFRCAWDVVRLRSMTSGPIKGDAEQLLLKRMLSRLEVQTVLLERKNTLLNFANAILLVGALISGAAYQGWLQPPLGYSFQVNGEGTGYANVEQSRFVQGFTTSNAIAFYMAVGSMIAGATTAIPAREDANILRLLKCVEVIVVAASLMLSISVAFLMNSFWYAGFAIVDTPSAISHGLRTMHGFMIAGNVVCVFLFGIALVRLSPLLLSPFFARHPQFLKFCPIP